jgi:hypothetical protein
LKGAKELEDKLEKITLIAINKIKSKAAEVIKKEEKMNKRKFEENLVIL